jgi:hypothetical protein
MILTSTSGHPKFVRRLPVRDHMELAMPKRDVDVGVRERFDPREQRLQHHRARCRVLEQPGVGIGNPAADVMTRDVDRSCRDGSTISSASRSRH